MEAWRQDECPFVVAHLILKERQTRLRGALENETLFVAEDVQESDADDVVEFIDDCVLGSESEVIGSPAFFAELVFVRFVSAANKVVRDVLAGHEIEVTPRK